MRRLFFISLNTLATPGPSMIINLRSPLLTIFVFISFLMGSVLPLNMVQAKSIMESRIGPDQSSLKSEGDHYYLPLVLNRVTTLSKKIQRVNIPHFSPEIVFDETAILWFGEVKPTENYSDVRIGYTDKDLFVHVTIFDRLLWYDLDSPEENLDDWDAVSLYLDMDGNVANAPSSSSYRFVGQLSRWVERNNYQAVYQGNGSGWTKVSLPFTTEVGHRGNPNDSSRDSGWRLTYQIPFTSLGLAGPPAKGGIWGLGIAVHDRDDAGGMPIADKQWPTGMKSLQSRTWGQLSFGLPENSIPPSQAQGNVKIRNGFNGANVVDGEVGGHTNCGQGLDRFYEWGDANYTHIDRINIQNQYDVADFPCYSKFYITFPMENVPANKAISSARLTLYQFGNAGGGEWGSATSSLIQVFTVDEFWKEETITWNNSPQAVENVSRSRVPWLSSYPGADGIPRTWDVTAAVSEAHLSGKPLSLALYSADSQMHSGKYFWSSEFDLIGSRPSLDISWVDP
jgi:hypothetical protein